MNKQISVILQREVLVVLNTTLRVSLPLLKQILNNPILLEELEKDGLRFVELPEEFINRHYKDENAT